MGPNDMDPPEENPELEAFYDLLYAKYPWLEELAYGDHASWDHLAIQANFEEFLSFVIDTATDRGYEDAKAGLGMYIDWLEEENRSLEEVRGKNG